MRKLLCLLAALSILTFPSYATDTLNHIDAPIQQSILHEEEIPIEVSTEMIDGSTGVGTVEVLGINVRENPNLEADVIDVLYAGTQVIVLSEVGDWYCISYDDVIGFIYKDFTTFTQSAEADFGYGAIKVAAANIRQEPTMESVQVGAILEEEVVSIIGVEGEWYKIEFDETIGYIRSDLIDPTALEPEIIYVAPIPVVDTASSGPVLPVVSYKSEYVPVVEETAEPSPAPVEPESEAPSTSVSADVISVAYQYLGVPYVWGGTSPSGFDCSGFVQYVFGKCGYSLSRVASSQYYDGYSVSYNNLIPGDLVFFERTYATNGISHVGIYVGGGDFIHCASGGVKVSSLNENYYSSRYYGACRIIG